MGERERTWGKYIVCGYDGIPIELLTSAGVGGGLFRLVHVHACMSMYMYMCG